MSFEIVKEPELTVSSIVLAVQFAALDRAKSELITANTLPEIKGARDKFRAIDELAKLAGGQREIMLQAEEGVMRAERKAGALIAETVKHEGNRFGTESHDGTPLPDGITRNDSSRWQAVARIPEQVFEQTIAGMREDGQITQVGLLRLSSELARADKRKVDGVRVATIDLSTIPDGTFTTLVVDPPWDWGDEGDVDQLGRARPTYQTVPYDDLLKMPIGAKATADAHLYLWITNRSLPKGFTLLDAWGFRYVTCLTWVKNSFGMGNYFRGQTEQVLFGVRGSLPLARHDVGTCFSAPRGKEHSSKPDEFYALVQTCSPAPYLDVFGRQQREGWQIWG